MVRGPAFSVLGAAESAWESLCVILLMVVEPFKDTNTPPPPHSEHTCVQSVPVILKGLPGTRDVEMNESI